MEIIKLPVSQLNPAKYNPRVALKPGDRAYEKLRRSIEEYGYVDPIIVNKRGWVVVGGHQRLRVMRDMGVTEVDVSVVDLTPDKEKALNVALNKITGDWDMAALGELLEELKDGGFDMELTGFDDDEIDKIISDMTGGDEPEERKDVEEDNFDPAAAAASIKKTTAAAGDVWALGDHRLICGDATNAGDIGRLMGGKVADMVFTDPPYNVDYQGGTGEKMKILNDKMGNEQFYQFLHDAFSVMFKHTRPGGAFYCCHADSEGVNFRSAMIAAGWDMKQCLIWVKNSLVLGRQDYHWRHEPILYGWKPGAAHLWNADRRQTTVIDDRAGITVAPAPGGYTLTFASGADIVMIEVPSFKPVHIGTDIDTTIWRFDKPLRNGEHPTMKPIGIPARAIQNSSKAGDIVLDLFGGSGSTLIAAEQTDRVAYTSELDPVYVDVIIQRYEEFTGQRARRLKKGG